MVALLLALLVLALSRQAAAQGYQPLLPVVDASQPLTAVASVPAQFYVNLTAGMAAPVLRLDRQTTSNTGTLRFAFDGPPTPVSYAGAMTFRSSTAIIKLWTTAPRSVTSTLYVDAQLRDGFGIQVSYSPVTVLHMGTPITTGGSVNGPYDFYFSVDVPPEARDVTVRATMTDWSNILSMYVSQAFMPARGSGSTPIPDNDGQHMNNHYYETGLPAGQTTFIYISSTFQFTVEVGTPLLSGGAIAGIVVGCVAAVALVCVIVGCRTHAKEVDTDVRVRYVSWGSAVFITVLVALGPTITLTMGIVMYKYVGPALVSVGAISLAIALLCAGPRAFDMDTASGIFKVSVYWAFVLPVHTEYRIADIAQFHMAASRGSKGRSVYTMKMSMRDNRLVALEKAASNLAVDAREDLLAKMNKMLVKINGGVAALQPTEQQAATAQQQAAFMQVHTQQQSVLARQRALLFQQQAALESLECQIKRQQNPADKSANNDFL